tara:strand:+ start:671 stop:1735 length:1065 start_codon:yes stop_codon:yes gene_type:complete
MSDFRNILEETVKRLFQDIMADGMPHTNDEAVFKDIWASVEELGITNLFLTEDNGGFSGDWKDAFPVLKKLGYHAVPLPIGETIIAKKILQKNDMVVPEAAISIGIANQINIQRNDNSEQWFFSGNVPSTPWGKAAQSVLIQCRFNDNSYYVLLSTKNGSIDASDLNEADEPRDTFQFQNAPVIDLKMLSNDTDELYLSGALLRTCQAAGALEAALEMSIQHVQDREQFGRPLSKFQAIQHQLALLTEYTAVASCAAQSACYAYDKGDANFEIAAAKLRVNQTIGESTSIAHQVHGAIGFTQEHSLHHFSQRLWSWRSEFGNDRHWANYLGKEIVKMEQEQLWATLTNRSDGKV